MTRDEDDYREKVRKFVEEAAKYTKDRKNQEKKKDRKKSKKNKKDSKKKKKEKKHKKDKEKGDLINGMELREALKYVTFHSVCNHTLIDFFRISEYLRNCLYSS